MNQSKLVDVRGNLLRAEQAAERILLATLERLLPPPAFVG
jgi:hypothetical protein